MRKSTYKYVSQFICDTHFTLIFYSQDYDFSSEFILPFSLQYKRCSYKRAYGEPQEPPFLSLSCSFKNPGQLGVSGSDARTCLERELLVSAGIFPSPVRKGMARFSHEDVVPAGKAGQ